MRTHGLPPYTIAVLHGGPGAPGEMAPVARELADRWGVLEPLQTAHSVDGQVAELRADLEHHADLPISLIGYSWGAWLAYLLAAHRPALVRQLILVSSGPFEPHYASQIMSTRLSRLDDAERQELERLLVALEQQSVANSNAVRTRVGQLLDKTDTYYDPLPVGLQAIAFEPSVYAAVWPEAAELRRSGTLLQLGRQIQCPVVAIHGDYDPHPSAGVRDPLSRTLDDFRFILLERCGHRPWVERQARDEFFAALRDVLGGA